MEIRIDDVEPSPTASVVGRKDLSQVMPRFDAVYAFVRGGQATVRQVGQNVILYDGDRMEVGVEVDGTFEPAGDVRPSSLPGGRVAHATHTTGYGDLHVTYAAIERWCAEHGHRLTSSVWEIYGDPDDTGQVDVEIRHLLAE